MDQYSNHTTPVKREIDLVLDALAARDSEIAAEDLERHLEDAKERAHLLIDVLAAEISATLQNRGRYVHELSPVELDMYQHLPMDESVASGRMYIRPWMSLIDTVRPILVWVAGLAIYLYLALKVFTLSFAQVRSFLVEFAVLGGAGYICSLIAWRFRTRRVSLKWIRHGDNRYGR